VEGLEMNFWKDKSVFITGHTGFKGSWLCSWLELLGARVSGYSLEPPTTPSMYEIAKVEKNIASTIGDIRDRESLLAAVKKAKPEVVIHLAAQSLVRTSYREPVETYSTNVMGTVHVLDCVRQVPGVKVVLIVTSDKCYDNKEWWWGYRENDAMGGFDPYSSSKGCAELVTAAFRSSFFSPAAYAAHGVAVASARAGNVIGGGDWAMDRLIPDFVRAVSEKKTLMVRNPEARRPWQHVLEPLSGYLLLCEKLATCGAEYATGWNFGPNDDDAKSVEWIATAFADCWGPEARWEWDRAEHPHEARYLKLDCSMARQRLGWRSRTSVAQAIELTASWYKQFSAGSDMRQITIDQIKKFEKLTTPTANAIGGM
jgi:CDP-glucose 4,6-dehydratase